MYLGLDDFETIQDGPPKCLVYGSLIDLAKVV